MIVLKKKKSGTGHHGQFEARETWNDRIVVLSVGVAVDLLSAPRLTEAIRYALAMAPAGLIVDLTEVEFLASVGMSVLVDAQEQANAASARFAVVADDAVVVDNRDFRGGWHKPDRRRHERGRRHAGVVVACGWRSGRRTNRHVDNAGGAVDLERRGQNRTRVIVAVKDKIGPGVRPTLQNGIA